MPGFHPDNASAAARKSVQVRRARAARRSLASEAVYRVLTELDDVAPAALQAALVALQRAGAALEEVPVETTLDAKRVAETAEIVHRISRLASGQSTANVAHANMTDEERAERMAYLRSRIGQLDADAVDDADTATPPAP